MARMRNDDVSILALAQRASLLLPQPQPPLLVSILALAQRASNTGHGLRLGFGVSILALAQRASVPASWQW